jgi:peptidyl-prolyl cis-trans isomerase D
MEIQEKSRSLASLGMTSIHFSSTWVGRKPMYTRDDKAFFSPSPKLGFHPGRPKSGVPWTPFAGFLSPGGPDPKTVRPAVYNRTFGSGVDLMIRFLQTPSQTKKIVIGAILVLICGAMVVTLIPGGFLGDSFGFGSPAQGVLAKVGDQEVTFTEAQQAVRLRIQQQFGGRGNVSSLMPLLLPSAVRDLVDQKAMVVEAERMGLRVGDQEVANWLQHEYGSLLFPGGQFIGNDRYEEFTERNFNLTVPQFEEEVKTELLLTKLRTVVEAGVTVSDEQVRQEFTRRNTKVKFEYAVLTREDVEKEIHPAEAELKAYYDKNQRQFANSIPEKRQFQYVVIDASRVKAKAEVTPADLRNYYNAHLDEFRVPEEVKVRHILIKTPTPGPDGKVNDKAVEAARAKAEDILKKLKAGGDFAELAKKSSEDTASATQGGELGWVQRGRVPGFEQEAFSLPPGQTSDLIQSNYGFHIIQVEEKHTPRVKPLEEVKAEIEPLIALQKAGNLAENLADRVQAESRTAGLASAAAKNGLEVMNSPLVSRTESVPGIGIAPEFMTAVFGAKEKNPPESVHLPQGFAIFQVTSIAPPATPTFDEAKSKVEEAFKRERAGQLLAQKIQELSDRAHAEHSLKKAAEQAGATLKTSDLVGPDSQVPDIGSLASQPASAILEMKPGDISSPLQTPRGDAVVNLLEKQEPAITEFDQQKESIRETLLEQKRREMLTLFVDGLRQRMEKDGRIRIYKQQMERLMPKPEES